MAPHFERRPTQKRLPFGVAEHQLSVHRVRSIKVSIKIQREAPMHSTPVSTGIFTIEQFFDAAECEALIQRAQELGFEPAPIITARGSKVVTEARNNERCVLDDVQLAQSLWQQAERFVPAVMREHRAVGLNERFRIYRYVPGQRFAWHADMPFHRNHAELSLLTFMVYLNTGYEGGATRFEGLKVVGNLGQALVFQHGLLHEGAEVTKGVKYALRTDVMYRKMNE